MPTLAWFFCGIIQAEATTLLLSKGLTHDLPRANDESTHDLGGDPHLVLTPHAKGVI